MWERQHAAWLIDWQLPGAILLVLLSLCLLQLEASSDISDYAPIFILFIWSYLLQQPLDVIVAESSTPWWRPLYMKKRRRSNLSLHSQRPVGRSLTPFSPFNVVFSTSSPTLRCRPRACWRLLMLLLQSSLSTVHPFAMTQVWSVRIQVSGSLFFKIISSSNKFLWLWQFCDWTKNSDGIARIEASCAVLCVFYHGSTRIIIRHISQEKHCA